MSIYGVPEVSFENKIINSFDDPLHNWSILKKYMFEITVNYGEEYNFTGETLFAGSLLVDDPRIPKYDSETGQLKHSYKGTALRPIELILSSNCPLHIDRSYFNAFIKYVEDIIAKYLNYIDLKFYPVNDYIAFIDDDSRITRRCDLIISYTTSVTYK